jgi:hypothetical protein
MSLNFWNLTNIDWFPYVVPKKKKKKEKPM